METAKAGNGVNPHGSHKAYNNSCRLPFLPGTGTISASNHVSVAELPRRRCTPIASKNDPA